MTKLEFYRDWLLDNPALAKKYSHFCEWKDGRLIAINIQTGKYSGTLPTEFGKSGEFDAAAKKDGMLSTDKVINYRDELGV